ncbi:hypothetical protein [Candidatus Pristimantibacillus sp. PTI5]|uniref:hypothetical protein n=1 Tax=Candidatus Pristimantibacillus sp. PTI5 TaxID=3400422 RepID=UPI003B029B14
MTEEMNERSKKVKENFDRILPDIWKKARMNAHLMAKEYVTRLRTENTNRRSEEVFTIKQCVMCGSHDVPNKTLEIPVNLKGIVSVRILGAQCSNPSCNEEYYDSDDLQAIRDMKKLLKQREHERRIKPLHQQSKEYRESSARAAQDWDEEDE